MMRSVSTTVLVTLYESHYHFGVGALVNSLISAGFNGEMIVGFRDEMPPWIKYLKPIGECQYVHTNVVLTFKKLVPNCHFGYYKPTAALEALKLRPQADAVVYLDPDILFLTEWVAVEEWLCSGVTLVEDAVFPAIHINHPWRKHWRSLGVGAGFLDCPSFGINYPNSGFVGLKRQCTELLVIWERITEQFAKCGDVSRFHMAKRTEAIVSDQDLLAAALMFYTGPVSFLDGHAMGFHNYHYFLSHAIESPKPWVRPHLLKALRGEPPSRSAALYLEFCNKHFVTVEKASYIKKKFSHFAGKLLSRFYSR